MNNDKPTNHLVERALNALKKEYVVVGKTHVKSWHAWLIIGVAVGIIATTIFIANRNLEIERIEAVTPKESKAIQTIAQVGKFGGKILQKAKKANFTIPAVAQDRFNNLLTQAKSELINKDFGKTILLANEAKESFDYPGASKAVSSAESFREKTVKAAARENFIIPAFAKQTSLDLLNQAKGHYTNGYYPETKEAAKSAQEAIDYKALQKLIQKATQARKQAVSKGSPSSILNQFDAKFAEAQKAFEAGDYIKATSLLQETLQILKEDVVVSTPTITPSGGNFVDTVTVTLETDTVGATIYYTNDNTDPTTNSLLYSGPFTLTDSTVIKAMALLNNKSSGIAKASFVIAFSVPEEEAVMITPKGGGKAELTSDKVTITMQTSIAGAKIYYTTDGRTPDPQNSTLYTSSFTLDLNRPRLGKFNDPLRVRVVKARAFVGNTPQGALAHETYFGNGTSRFNKEKWYGGDKAYIAQVYFLDIPAVPQSQVERIYRHPTQSFDAFLRMISFNQRWVAGKIIGPYLIEKNASDLISAGAGKCSDYFNAVVNEGKQLIKNDGLDPDLFGVKFFVPSTFINSKCPFAFGNEGMDLATLTSNSGPIHTEFHDTTHIGHASTINCFPGRPIDKEKYCDHLSYDIADEHDILGRSWPDGTNHSAPEKSYFGYLPSDRFPEVTKDGVYTINTISVSELPPTGPMALRIRKPNFYESIEKTGSVQESYYSIEYRQPIGFDELLGDDPKFTQGVNIRLARIPLAGSEGLSSTHALYRVDETDRNNLGTVNVGMTALADGQSFYDDVDNITIKQLNHTLTTATVEVKFGPVPCSKAPPRIFMTGSNKVEVAPGGESLVRFNIYNADMRSCASKPFTMRYFVSGTSGVTATFSPGSPTITAGSEQDIEMRIKADKNVAEGTYFISFAAQDATSLASLTERLALNVKAGVIPQAPSVTFSFSNPQIEPHLKPASGKVTIRALISNPPFSDRQELLVDNVVVASTNTATDGNNPYAFIDWDTKAIPDGTHSIKVRASYRGVAGESEPKKVIVWNSSKQTPNLHIFSVPKGTKVQKDTPVELTMTVANNGTASSGNVKVYFFPSLSFPPNFSTVSPIPAKTINLAPANGENVTFKFTPPTLGMQTAYVRIDDGDPGTVDEIDDTLQDNLTSFTYEVIPKVLPNLQVFFNSLGDADGQVKTGVKESAEIDIHNVSAGGAEGVKVRVRFHPELTIAPDFNTASPVADKTVTLDANGEATVTFQFTAGSTGTKTAWVVVDDGDPGSVDEVNDSIGDNSTSRGYTVKP